MRPIFTIFAVFMACSPAAAADCYTLDRLEAVATEQGAQLATVPVKADHMDMVVIVQGDSALTIWAFDKGCFIGWMASLDTVTRLQKGTPA